MTLADHQQTYRGLTLGEGTGYRLYQVDGLEDLDIRDGDRDAPRDDGGIPGSHFAAQKTFVLIYRIATDDHDELEALLAEFYRTFTRRLMAQDEFVFKFPGQIERMVRARPIRRGRPRTRPGTVSRTVELVVAMKATDPRIYSTDEQGELVPIALVLEEEGFELPVVNLPINMAAAVINNATLVVGGTSEAYPVLQFQYDAAGTGDVDGLILTNVSNGSVFEMGQNPSGTDFALVAGDTLVADMDAIVRKVPDLDPVRIDDSSQYTFWQMPRQPFYLSPGPNVLTFEVVGASPSDDVAALVQWRNTDL